MLILSVIESLLHSHTMYRIQLICCREVPLGPKNVHGKSPVWVWTIYEQPRTVVNYICIYCQWSFIIVGCCCFWYLQTTVLKNTAKHQVHDSPRVIPQDQSLHQKLAMTKHYRAWLTVINHDESLQIKTNHHQDRPWRTTAKHHWPLLVIVKHRKQWQVVNSCYKLWLAITCNDELCNHC